MTGFGTVETAIEAMKKGAYDYILKPFKVEEVIHVVQRGLDRQRLQHENIRLKEALSLYKISEAIATSLSVEKVLDLVLDATIDTVDADVVSLLLEDPKQAGHFTERMRKVSERAEPNVEAPALNLDEVLPLFREDRPLLVHGSRAYRFFAVAAATSIGGWSASARSRSSCNGRIIGMLNAYTYTRGNKFTEGQRKMLSVLASRAAVSIENARLYEDLVDANNGSDARQRVAGGELQADHHRLRARARGVGPLHARPLRARRDVRAPDRASACTLSEPEIDTHRARSA